MTLQVSGQIFLYPDYPSAVQGDAPVERTLAIEVRHFIKQILEICERRVIVVGEADKALKELRLTALAVNIMELCRDKTVRAILAETAPSEQLQYIQNFNMPLSIKFVVEGFGVENPEDIEGETRALCAAFKIVRERV